MNSLNVQGVESGMHTGSTSVLHGLHHVAVNHTITAPPAAMQARKSTVLWISLMLLLKKRLPSLFPFSGLLLAVSTLRVIESTNIRNMSAVFTGSGGLSAHVKVSPPVEMLTSVDGSDVGLLALQHLTAKEAQELDASLMTTPGFSIDQVC